jgi:hypothetical protein
MSKKGKGKMSTTEKVAIAGVALFALYEFMQPAAAPGAPAATPGSSVPVTVTSTTSDGSIVTQTVQAPPISTGAVALGPPGGGSNLVVQTQKIGASRGRRSNYDAYWDRRSGYKPFARRNGIGTMYGTSIGFM